MNKAIYIAFVSEPVNDRKCELGKVRSEGSATRKNSVRDFEIFRFRNRFQDFAKISRFLMRFQDSGEIPRFQSRFQRFLVRFQDFGEISGDFKISGEISRFER